ncbi:MAG: glutamate synthase subunit beta [Candidatus Omnitrophica bacterium]|nr:glutamate synthase subunit beta [Candidatus Omnitrophota bacterium]
MGDIKGFLKVKRQTAKSRPVCERIKDYCEVCTLPTQQQSHDQASRCMDCGTPFCHWGCPIGNYIPEWNDLVFRGQWRKALELLEAANNLPEVTGRICPAICEYACVLGFNDDAVTIRENELAIIERGFKEGWIHARPPKKRTGKKIAVIGSGPAGLSCAAQLNQAGHKVLVFERDHKAGGVLRYGIPDFKLEKSLLERRIKLWQEEGIEFKTDCFVGKDYPVRKMLEDFDAIALAGGSRAPRDLKIEGRDLKGIYFAMDFLTQSNLKVAGEKISAKESIDAKNKKVVVIGGGDTGADCVGVANRQGARCVVQIELLPQPPACRGKDSPWPTYPMLLKTSSSHEEGVERRWAVLTKKFLGSEGNVQKLFCVQVEFEKDEKGCFVMHEIKKSEFEIAADLVVLALGFLHPEHNELLTGLGLEFDPRGNVKTAENFMTSVNKVFSCGDMHRGQSLIVWAICEGRKAAYHIDSFLMGSSHLPVL